jgi:hypothetical protein
MINLTAEEFGFVALSIDNALAGGGAMAAEDGEDAG